ncbi:hypothetical protein [Vibrio crassostreae]|uniref:hypothetical protein n=1 Tax=Vibrio crassostreae TaxID=246167 RepID=UPI001B3075B8|nr:hypothetical protein [Vibrio crassostreae]
MKKWNHKEITEKAVKWLKKSLGQGGCACHVAISEFPTGWTGEIPDAIGFRANSEALGGSVVCEVKVSRSDFLADAKKPHRNGSVLGVGKHRFYVVPEGLISIEELPEGWGLVYITQRGAAKCVHGYPSTTHQGERNKMFEGMSFNVDFEREQNVLVRLLGRLGDTEELNNIKRENGRLARENKELKDKTDKFEVAEHMKQLEAIESSRTPIKRQLIRTKNRIKRAKHDPEW